MEITEKPLVEVAKAVPPFMILLILCLMSITYIPSVSTIFPNWRIPQLVLDSNRFQG